MIRRIIEINEDKCIGCGLCAEACHEGAIQMIDGKAKLTRDDYCDGLGDCLPSCPTEAISFVEREAAEYNEQAVKENQAKKAPLPCGCSGTQVQELKPKSSCDCTADVQSELLNWPIQIKLVPTNAPYFDKANLLIAADCTAYAYGNFHNDFMKNHIALIGCPKLDEGDYSEKLTEIIRNNNILSVTVARMSVPCCAGLVAAAKTAIANSGKTITFNVSTFSPSGAVME